MASCVWHAQKRETPDALYHDARDLLRRGDPKTALVRADAGLRAEPSPRFQLLKAEILLTSGQVPEAARFLESLSPPEQPQLHARWRMLQAQADYMQSDFLRAESALKEARTLAAGVNDPMLSAEIDMREASLDVRRGDTSAADPIFRRVLHAATEHGDDYLAANAMGNLGYLYLNASRYDQAIYWLERALREFQKLGSEVLYARTLGNLGACHFRIGNYDQAVAYSEEAARRSAKAGNKRDQQTWLGTIATARLDQGDYAQAAAGFREVLAIALETGNKESAAWWLNNLTLASINLGDLDAAERYNRQTLELGVSTWSDYYRRVHEAEIAAARKDLPRAETLFRAVLTAQSADPAPVLDAETGLAEVLAKSGRFAAAEAEFRSAMTRIEHERSQLVRDEYKLSYQASLMDTYQKYVDFLVERGETDRALEIAESGRARLLDDKLNAKKDSPRQVSSAVLRGIARSSGCVLLSYWLGPQRSFVWSVTRDRIAAHVLPAEKKITPLVESYRSFIEALRDPLAAEFSPVRELSATLLGPVQSELAAGSCAFVVPDRSLNSLNFETLPDPENGSRYFVDRVTLEVAPSLGLIAARAPEAKSKPSILLIGNPEPAVEEYPRLPYAGREMKTIAAAVQPARVFEGAEARPAVYRESHPETFQLDPLRRPCERQPPEPARFSADSFARERWVRAAGSPGDECSAARIPGHHFGLPERRCENLLG
jgi:tetratricopeptide (TPR) repeat protein